MDIEAIYAAVVDGTGTGGDLAWTRAQLLHLALHRAKTGTAPERLGALRVGALLGAPDGLVLASELVTDPDPAVRTAAFEQAVSARERGIPAIRAAAGAFDPALAARALALLGGWVDGQALPLAWRALGAPDPVVRHNAAVLVGHIAGPGVTADLRRLAATDADRVVRAAAAEALERIAGDRPRGARRPWWNPEDPAPPLPAPPLAAASSGGASVGPAASAGPAASMSPSLSSPAVVAPAPHAEASLAGAAPPAPASGFARLPAELPTETRALVRLAGMVAPADRARVAGALPAAAATEWSALMLGWTPGSDPALARGLAWTAAELGRTSAVARLARMLADEDPSVRCAALDALAALGAAGDLPALVGRFADPVPGVAVSAIHALTALAVRIGRPDLARDQLRRVVSRAPEVTDAVEAARARLG